MRWGALQRGKEDLDSLLFGFLAEGEDVGGGVEVAKGLRCQCDCDRVGAKEVAGVDFGERPDGIVAKACDGVPDMAGEVSLALGDVAETRELE